MQKRKGCLGVDRDWDWDWDWGFGDEGIDNMEMERRCSLLAAWLIGIRVLEEWKEEDEDSILFLSEYVQVFCLRWGCNSRNTEVLEVTWVLRYLQAKDMKIR